MSSLGSPVYIAPEIIEENGYDHLVDYWALGIIMYELFYGITPFESDHIKTLYDNISYSKVIFDEDYEVS